MKCSHYNQSSNESGIYFVLTAVIVSALVLLVALAVDVGMLYRDRLVLQKAADSAAAVALTYQASHRYNGTKNIRDGIVNAVVNVNTKGLSGVHAYPVFNDQVIDDIRDGNETLPEFTYHSDIKGQDITIMEGDTAVTIPAQSLAIAVEYKPNLFFAPLKSVAGIRSNASSIGTLTAANVALVLDFSASMCGKSDDANPNIPYCDAKGALAGRRAFDPDSKAAKLVEGVGKFLQNFRVRHDHISLTIFNSSAETIAPMSNDGSGTIDGNTHTWLPESDGKEDYNLINDGGNSIWPLQIVGVERAFQGNTNPSDGLLRAYLDTMAEKRAGVGATSPLNDGPIHYVFFTDGAPTAGRFIIPAKNEAGNRLNSLPDSTVGAGVSGKRNVYNPYELEFWGLDFGGMASSLSEEEKRETPLRFFNIGDYYHYKVMQAYSFDPAKNNAPSLYQYTPSAYIRTAISNAADKDDGNINAEVGNDNENRSLTFDNLDRPEFGKKLFSGGVWQYLYTDDKFEYLPACSYGGRYNEILTRGEYSNGIASTTPEIINAFDDQGNPLPPIYSHYNRYYEIANLGVCCDLEGNKLEYKIDLRGEAEIDLCADQPECQAICSDAAGSGLPKCNGYQKTPQKDKVYDKLIRCINQADQNLCIDGINRVPADYTNCFMQFAVPYTGKVYSGRIANDEHWPRQYYDAAIEYADLIRENPYDPAHKGIIYAIGLGGDPVVQDDFYQDENDDFHRHDYFLTRLVQDPYVCELDDSKIASGEDESGENGCGLKDENCSMAGDDGRTRVACQPNAADCYNQLNADYTGYKTWREIGVEGEDPTRNCFIPTFNYGDRKRYDNRYKDGDYLQTNNAADLPSLFQQIAKKILISLSR